MRVAHTARGLAAGFEPCDVLLVGGGPAGSTAARLLAQLGWTVRLLDRARFPRPKPCGECLNPGAVAALERLGVLERVLALQPASLDGWTVSAERAVARGRFPHGAGGLSLDRARLDAALLDAARAAGVEVVEGTRVTGLVHTAEEKRAGTVAVLTAAPVHPVHRARIVVGADGLRSVVARALSAYRRSPRLRKLSITLHVEGAGLDPRQGRLWIDGEGTVGLAALDPDGRSWNATAVVDADARGRAVAGDPVGFTLARLAALLTGSAPRSAAAPRLVAGPWASGPFDWPTRRAVADRVVLVGDAAGYFDPLTGQGIYRALRSAELAAQAIDRALRADRAFSADLAGYETALRDELRAPLRVQRGVEAVISRGPLRRGALALLGRRTHPMDTLIAITGDLAPVRSLLRPTVWLRRTRSVEARARGRP